MGKARHSPQGLISTLIQAPSAALLSIAEAKAHCRVDFDDDDQLIEAYVEAANDMLDARWGELGMALITQRWQVTLPVWPSENYLHFPVAPVQQIATVTYYDAENSQQTLSSGVYRLVADPQDPYIEVVDGETFPATYARPDAIAIQYDAGFGDAVSDVPQGIRVAARLMVGHWYEQRSAVTERAMAAMPIGVRSLLMKYRVARGHI